MDNNYNTTSSNNIESSWWCIILFYTISSILLIGCFINLILVSKFGESFNYYILKRHVIINVIIKILLWVSIFYFPIVAFYLFTQFYVYKNIDLF